MGRNTMQKKLIAIMLAYLGLAVISLAHADAGWLCNTCHKTRYTPYCPYCGQYKGDNSNSFWYCTKCNKALTSHDCFCPIDGTPRPANPYNKKLKPDECFYDIGIPDLQGRSFKQDDMSLAVYWVQVQLKATGIYYQGEIWDETGNLGDHTMQEISSFMQSRGYYNHSGCVDQVVINELAAYLGDRTVPVYIGGFYKHMDSIMNGGHTGSMQRINSNLIDMIPHVTVGGRWVQCCLAKLGYYKGTIDGKYGEKTEEAVNAFQKDYGFEQRNYVTLGVARTMLEACHARKCFLDDLP